MSTGSRFVLPYQTVINNVGVPLPGALLNFYASGTSTPLATYADESLTVPNANPVVANGAGVFPNIFLQSRAYKVVLEDENGVEQWTADPVLGAGVGQSLSITRQQIPTSMIFGDTIMVSGYWTPGDPGTGAIYTSNAASSGGPGAVRDANGTWFNLVIEDGVNVGWFGAKFDGATDDTAAFAAAMLVSAGRELSMPVGTTVITSTITLVEAVHLKGQVGANRSSPQGTIIDATGCVGFVFKIWTPNGSYTYEAPKFSNFQMNCQSGIQLNNPAGGFTDDPSTQNYMMRGQFVNVVLTGTIGSGVGISVSKGFETLITESYVGLFDICVDFYGCDFTEINHNRFQEGNVEINITAENTFGNGCYISDNDMGAMISGAGNSFIRSSARDITIENNIMEAPSAPSVLKSFIDFTGGFERKVYGNGMHSGSGVVANAITTTADFSLLAVRDNYTTSAGAGPISFTTNPPYWYNVVRRCLIIDDGNFFGGFPFDSSNTYPIVPLGGVWNSSSYGFSTANDGVGILVQPSDGAFILPARLASYNVVFSDYVNFITGNILVSALLYASAPCTVTLQVIDLGGGGLIDNVTLNLTTVATWYQVPIAAITTQLVVGFISGNVATTFIREVAFQYAAVATAAQFADKTSAINTVAKYASKQAWVSDAARVVFATGSADTDTWKDGVNSVVYTPS